jgi:MFS family permease
VFALRVVQGLFAGYGGLTLAMAAESAPRARMAAAIGWVQTAQRLGPAIGPAIGGSVAGAVGLRRAFFITAAFYLAAFVVVLVFYREHPVTPARAPAADQPRADVRSLLRGPGFLLMMAAIFGVTFVDRSFGPVLPLYVERLGVEAGRVAIVSGILFAVTAAGAAVGNHLCEWLLARAAPGAVVAGSGSAAAGALLAFLAAPGPWLVGAALLVFGVFVGIATTAAYTVGGRTVPAAMHATGFGFLSGAWMAGLAVSPVIAGLLSRHSLMAVFGVDVVILALLGVVVYRGVPPGQTGGHADSASVSAPDAV